MGKSWHSWFTVDNLMDSTQRLIEKLVERRMQNTGESQSVATANVMAAFEKIKKTRPRRPLISNEGHPGSGASAQAIEML